MAERLPAKHDASEYASTVIENMADEEIKIETIPTRYLSRADALAIGELIVQTWPKPGVTVEDRADKLQTDRGVSEAPDEIASRSFVLRQGSRVIGHALVFPRTIGTTAGPMTIAALASVCTDQAVRGKKLGERLVRAAWADVDQGLFPFSLFQTSARASTFYVRLGAGLIENTVVDSTAEDLTVCPFKDEHIVRYPALGREWPTGPIDLLGPGY